MSLAQQEKSWRTQKNDAENNSFFILSLILLGDAIVMTYPRLTTELNGDYLRMAQDWDPMVRLIRDTIAGFTPTAGNFNLPCAFLITVDSSNYYYAISGGQIIYGGPDDVGGVDGEDAQAVIQAAITYCAGKGVIALREGVYPLLRKLVVSKGVSLIGSGSNCAFKEIYNEPVTQIIADAAITDDRLIECTSGYYGTLANFNLDANYVSDKNLYLFSPQGATFKKLVLHHANAQNCILEVDGTTATHNLFEQVIISDTTGIGMDMIGTATYPVTLNTFIGCRFSALTTSLRLQKYCDTNTFIQGRVEAYHGFGIVLGDTDPGCYANAFYNVPIDGQETDSFGIYLNSGAESPNYFYGGVFGGSLAAASSATKVQYHNDYGAWGGRFYNYQNYVTERFGTTTVVDGGTISAALAIAPNDISLQSSEEEYEIKPSAWDDDGVTVTVRHWNSSTQNYEVATGSHALFYRIGYQPQG
jgi:hypothetical protein